MAAEVLPVHPIANSTYVVHMAFTDEDGNPVTPNTITWSLKDEAGTVINSRTAVVVGSPASAVDVVLQGDDLDAGTCDVRKLLFTVTAPYDSGLGTDLPLIDQCWLLVNANEPSD